MAVRDGGLRAAVPAIMALLVVGMTTVALPCAAIADPPAHEMSLARFAPIAVAVDPWGPYVMEAAKRFAIPERWLRAVIRAESDHDPHAISPKGAIGLMQIMPATWHELRTRYHLGDDPFDRRDNILAGAAYLAELHDLYGSPGFLAAYNAGPGRYEKHLVSDNPLPAETIAYMAKIVPQIDAEAAIAYRTTDRSAGSEWSVAPLFVARTAVDDGDGWTADELPSGRSSGVRTITDLSALAPSSDGLFMRRSPNREIRP